MEKATYLDQCVEFTTGSRRGYIKIADQGKESEMKKIPEDISKLRGNMRKAMKALTEVHHCTHYTITYYQGVPGK